MMDKYMEEYASDLRQMGCTELEILDVIREDLDNFILVIMVKRDQLIQKIKDDLHEIKE